jgi:hypothetical protein
MAIIILLIAILVSLQFTNLWILAVIGTLNKKDSREHL